MDNRLIEVLLRQAAIEREINRMTIEWFTPPPTRYFIIAPTPRIAEHYAIQHHINKPNWRWVSHVEMILPLQKHHGLVVWLVGEGQRGDFVYSYWQWDTILTAIRLSDEGHIRFRAEVW